MKPELFTAPFPPEQIKPKPGGGNFDYIEYGDVARRLIEATENDFGWEIVRAEMASLGDKWFWWVHGRLSVPGLGARDGIGVQDVIPGPQNTEAIKAAETDAFKRAARNFGIGLELYDKDRKAPAGRNGYSSTNGQAASSRPPEVASQSGSSAEQSPGVWSGPGQCPQCHAPEGKRHGKPCV